MSKAFADPGRVVSARLAELGINLPPAKPGSPRYVTAVRSSRHVFASGQFPLVDGRLATTGVVDAEVSVKEAVDLARRYVVNARLAIDAVAGVDSVTRIVKVVGVYVSAPEFTGQPAIVDGASQALLDVLAHLASMRGPPWALPSSHSEPHRDPADRRSGHLTARIRTSDSPNEHT